jgi:hypothetical protein
MDTYAGILSDPMSLHKYLFANSNPVMYSDPSGHYTLTEQETAIAIQAILGEAISGAFYIVDWFINDPDSKNHSIGKMIIAMMLGLARSAVMGSWGGLLSSLISKAGMSVLDYLLTGIMFALFSGNLKLAAINLRESGNFKVAAICNAGGAFADFVAFCSVINAVSTYAASKADNKSSKTKKYRNNKRGAVRIGEENSNDNASAEKWGTSPEGRNQGLKHFYDYRDKYPDRMPSLEKRLGVPEGAFSKSEEGFKNFTKQAERVISEATKLGNVRSVGGRTMYYLDGVANPKKGVAVIVEYGKIQTMMPSDWKSFINLK